MGKYSFLKDKLTRFVDPDGDYNRKIEARKQQLLKNSPPNEALCDELATAKAEKKRLEESTSAVNLTITALEKILAERFEDAGTLKLSTGSGTFSIADDPVIQFPDKHAFNSWVREQGMEDLLSVHYQTAAGIIKEKLLKGDPLPPGTAVYMSVGINYTKAKA